MNTTLNQIRAHSLCAVGYKKLLQHLGKTQADDEALSIAAVLNSNGLNDALWCLRAVEGYDREIRLYAVWCARQVQHLMIDPRSLNAIDVAERFANGQATADQLKNAHQEAGAAVEVAVAATAATAGAAAWAAVAAMLDTAAAAVLKTAEAARSAARGGMRAKQADKLRELCGSALSVE